MKHTVFITGARKGIGSAIAEKYAENGWEVIAPSREELELSSPANVQQYLTSYKGPSIDALINNAGENKVNPFDSISLSDWERMFSVNLTAAFLLTQTFSKMMCEKGFGRIVNISSVYSLVSRPGRAAYSATKAGLNGLTRSTALELGSKNILVNSVCPGFVRTELTAKNNSPEQIQKLLDQTAVKRMAEPKEIAEIVFFLGSDLNTYMTGQEIVIDGGFLSQ
jgi:3-oxoacyl-[acyl-carrier protein] reductase